MATMNKNDDVETHLTREERLRRIFGDCFDGPSVPAGVWHDLGQDGSIEEWLEYVLRERYLFEALCSDCPDFLLHALGGADSLLAWSRETVPSLLEEYVRTDGGAVVPFSDELVRDFASDYSDEFVRVLGARGFFVSVATWVAIHCMRTEDDDDAVVDHFYAYLKNFVPDEY